MVFSVASSELYHHLNKVIGPVGTNNIMPILEDFLLVLEGEQLTVTATDLETTVTTSLQVNSEDTGIIACPAKMLLETVKALQNQPITFDVSEETKQITVSSPFGKYNMSGHDPADFPQISAHQESDSLKLSSVILQRGIAKSIFATSNDEMRKTMMGVYFQIDFSKMNVVATDAHKLVRYQFNNINSDVTTSFVLPKKPLILLKSILDSDDEVNFEFDKSHAYFTFGDTTLACRMLEGKYPDYNLVIPTNNPNQLKVKRHDLLSSLKRLAIYANKTTNQTVFSLTENSLTLTSQDFDYSNEATEQLSCDYNGDDLTIAFNAKFLIEMLSALETDEVVFQLSENNRPGIIVPDENSENEDLLMLIMPVTLGY
jgi:DNA polymerase-3 subunit beta